MALACTLIQVQRTTFSKNGQSKATSPGRVDRWHAAVRRDGAEWPGRLVKPVTRQGRAACLREWSEPLGGLAQRPMGQPFNGLPL